MLPFSFLVKSATGLDHPETIKRLREGYPNFEGKLVPGNFLDIDFDPDHKYDRIVIYSVLHCLSDLDEATKFCGKAVSLLK